MYNPKDVFSEDGLDDYKTHVKNVKNGLFFITSMADDLHLAMDERGDRILQLMYELREELEKDKFILEGNGEKDDEDE